VEAVQARSIFTVSGDTGHYVVQHSSTSTAHTCGHARVEAGHHSELEPLQRQRQRHNRLHQRELVADALPVRAREGCAAKQDHRRARFWKRIKTLTLSLWHSAT
jgi:hypothetical protein